MSDFRPTAAQAAAISTRGSGVLVSAGAGSGKTRVLTQRLMSYILDADDPADIDEFLIITYTKAAAGELRGRIMEELSALEARERGSRRLRRQKALCGRAAIGTIHSFCASVLRENSHMLGLDPGFAIADEARAGELMAAALERVLEKRYAQPDIYPGFTLLADTVGAGRSDRRLADTVLQVHSRLQCHPWPERWARRQMESLENPGGSIGETVWAREYLSQLGDILDYWLSELSRLTEKFIRPDPAFSRRYMDCFSQGAESISLLRGSVSLGWERAAAAPPVKFGRKKPVRDLALDPDTEAMLDKRLDDCKDAMKRACTPLRADPQRLMEDIRRTAPALRALLELALDFDAEFSAGKRRAGLLDYSDLEHMAARLLTDEDGHQTALAAELSKRYREIMVDEYQDVSRVQEAIFQAVSDGGRKLFAVGDVKQSVYRFRLADPIIFTEKYKSFPDAASAAPGQPRKILLRENFRSRREILDAANCVFSLCMSEKLGDIDYDDNAALVFAAGAYSDSVPVPELMLLPVKKDEDGGIGDRIAAEAAFTAAKIKELVSAGTPITDGGVKRPAEYGDVTILLRALDPDAAVFRRELERLGIPTASGQSGGYFDSAEVSAAVALLKLIDSPRQDIPLLTVLSGPAVGFSADQLALIRAAAPKAGLFTALTVRAGEDENCAGFLAKLDALRQAAPDLSVQELLWEVYAAFDMPAVFSAMTDGEQRRTRLLSLAELAERYESGGSRGLHRFLLWLEQLAARGREPVMGGGRAAGVQIMSMHKSKGLEFPVVFLCGMGKQFNRMDTYPVVLVHPELGLGSKLTDTELRIEYSTLAREVIRQRMLRETMSEELRLLYVAMTRARERLFITAAMSDPESAVESARALLRRPMPPQLLAGVKSRAEWLIYSALADGGQRLRLSVAQDRAGSEAAADAPDLAPDAAAAPEAAELRRRLDFRYGHEAAQLLPSKVTATELKGWDEQDEEAGSLEAPRPRPFRLPDFARENRPLTGAERGTATHLVLQHMDLSKAVSLTGVREETERLRREGFLSDREAEAVDVRSIVRLFASPLGRRMLAADELCREFKFSLLCDASQLFGQAPGEQVLLQGVVDCFIREGDRLTVIDYKTDWAPDEARLMEKALHYARQLRTYAMALERMTGKKVKECVLYFLSASAAVRIPGEEGLSPEIL